MQPPTSICRPFTAIGLNHDFIGQTGTCSSTHLDPMFKKECHFKGPNLYFLFWPPPILTELSFASVYSYASFFNLKEDTGSPLKVLKCTLCDSKPLPGLEVMLCSLALFSIPHIF